MCIRDSITIIAPTPYKKKIEEQKLDPDTKAPILDKDGKIVTEEKEIEIPMFRPVKVFDDTLKEETAWQKDRIFSSWPRRSALRA